ncbi:hypothetical protein MRX96_043490 [Rhipicephalus microplus]
MRAQQTSGVPSQGTTSDCSELQRKGVVLKVHPSSSRHSSSGPSLSFRVPPEICRKIHDSPYQYLSRQLSLVRLYGETKTYGNVSLYDISTAVTCLLEDYLCAASLP